MGVVSDGDGTGGVGAAFDRITEWSAPAMVVVTAAATSDGTGDEWSGCLVGFSAQCGIDPRRDVVWISRENHTFGVALRATHLAVHHLRAGDHDLARHFGALTGDEVDKFAGIDVAEGPGGVPLVLALPVRWVGRVLEVVDLDADHVGFLLEPVAAEAPHGDSPPPLRLPDVDDVRPAHPA